MALGDSFTAGPGLAPTDRTSGFCLRSTASYPHLLAEALHVSSFTDVSCSGATTDDVLRPHLQPAQIAAVTPSATLVTVGIGGNDSGLFAALARRCLSSTSACAAYLRDELPGVLARTERSVTAVLDAVSRRAPRARVVLVGYLRISPASGTCAALGGSTLDAAGVAEGEQALDATLARAAAAARATFVSMRAASSGHDACAGPDAWTNGTTPSAGDGIALHPRKAGMQAVARAVEHALR